MRDRRVRAGEWSRQVDEEVENPRRLGGAYGDGAADVAGEAAQQLKGLHACVLDVTGAQGVEGAVHRHRASPLVELDTCPHRTGALRGLLRGLFSHCHLLVPFPSCLAVVRLSAWAGCCWCLSRRGRGGGAPGAGELGRVDESHAQQIGPGEAGGQCLLPRLPVGLASPSSAVSAVPSSRARLSRSLSAASSSSTGFILGVGVTVASPTFMVRPPHWRPLTHYVERGRTPAVPTVWTVRGHPWWC